MLSWRAILLGRRETVTFAMELAASFAAKFTATFTFVRTLSIEAFLPFGALRDDPDVLARRFRIFQFPEMDEG